MANFSNTYQSAGLYEFQSVYAGYHGYVSLVVCAYGIVSNVFNILVLTRKNMISTTNIILTGLALADLLTMVSYVPFALQFYIIHGSHPSPARNTPCWIHFFLFHINFSVTAHTVSIWLGVLLAVFRYVFVKLSRDRSKLCSNQKATYLTCLVYVWAVFILIPNYLSFTIARISGPQNETYYDLVGIDTQTAFGDAITRSNFWIHAIIIKLIPCALMSIFGFLLLGTMRHSHRRTKRLQRQSTLVRLARNKRREHARTTRMLVAVIVLFLFTELPQGVLALLSGILPGFFDGVYMPLGDAMDIVALINNAINFTLYCCMSKQFRLTFLRLFCAGKEPPIAGYSTNGKYNNVSIGQALM